MIKFLVSERRSRRLGPWRLARPLADVLGTLGEIAGAVATTLDDEQWRALAGDLDAAAALVRRHQ